MKNTSIEIMDITGNLVDLRDLRVLEEVMGE